MRRNTGGIWERFEKHAGRTFGEAAARYIREFGGKAGSKRGAALALEATLPYIGKMRLIDIDDEAMQTFKEERLAGCGPFVWTKGKRKGQPRPAMPGTVNRELTLVSTVLLKAARVWRWIPMAPQFQRVSGRTRMSYPLTWEEQDRLFKALPRGWATGAALFAVNTGVRRDELFGLKWSDMVPIPSLETFVFILSDTKNGHDRAVICNSLAIKAVNAQRDNGSKYIFPSGSHAFKGKRMRSISHMWLEAWKEAGLPSDPLVRKGIHNLRFTFASRLRAVGVPEEDRNALLGHANTNLAQHYAMPDIERLLKAAELVTERSDLVVLRPRMSA